MMLTGNRLPVLVGLIDAALLILILTGIGVVSENNIIGLHMWPIAMLVSTLAGWRGAISVQLVARGRSCLNKAALEGFVIGVGITLLGLVFMPAVQWQTFVMVLLPIAVAIGILGALTGISILFVNRWILQEVHLPGGEGLASQSDERLVPEQVINLDSGAKASRLSIGNTTAVFLVVLVSFGIAKMLSGSRDIQTGNPEITQQGGGERSSGNTSSGVASEYQEAVSKALPGYRIFSNEEFLQDEDQLKRFLASTEIAERRRKILGVIEGRFNADEYLDFAALAVNRSIKQAKDSESNTDEYSARLVVCLGTGRPSGFQCEILSTLNGDFVSLPYWVDLQTYAIHGEIACGDVNHQIGEYAAPIAVLYPEGWAGSGNISFELPARKLTLNYDAIGMYAIGVNAGWTLVRQADGSYLNCAEQD